MGLPIKEGPVRTHYGPRGFQAVAGPNGWRVFQNRSFCIVLVIASQPMLWRGQGT
jgi:hypothetical protein